MTSKTEEMSKKSDYRAAVSLEDESASSVGNSRTAGRPSFQTTAMLQLHSPKPLRMEGDMTKNWRTWRQMWDSYSTMSRIPEYPYDYQLAAFVMALGEDGLETYNTLTLSGESEPRSLDTIIRQLENHFVGSVNVTYERYIFRKRLQEETESIDQYLLAVRALAKTCNFGDMENEMIKDQIVCGVQEEALRRSLLQRRDLSLTTCVDTAEHLNNHQCRQER